MRKQQRHQRIENDIRYINEQYTEDVELAYIRAEASRAIIAAIDALPEKPRAVIRMAFLEGKKLPEIAEALKLSYNTVQNYRGKGLELLRVNLMKNKLLSAAVLELALSILEKN